jgi:hypothetical protein
LGWGGRREDTKNWGKMRSDCFVFLLPLSQDCALFPLPEALEDESPRLRLVTDTNPCVFVGSTPVSGTVTHDPLGSSIATEAALTNDEDAIVVVDDVTDGSTRVPRLAATAAVCRLRRLFDCGDCDAGGCGELAHDEPMLEID